MNINGLELPAALAANLRDAEYKPSASQRARLRKEMKWLNNPEPDLYNHRSITAERSGYLAQLSADQKVRSEQCYGNRWRILEEYLSQEE